MPIKVWTAHLLKWSVISTITGVCAGSAAAIFLISLEAITRTREAHDFLLWFLPLGGLIIGWLYQRFGARIERGNDLILEEIHNPKGVVPLKMAPMVLVGTLLTHLFGGSAGREGTAVQMGGAIADQLAKPFRLKAEDRRILLMAGMSAGFGSVFGVPFAGAVFGLEVLRVGRVHVRTVFECALASFVGHYTCLAWGIHHTVYSAPQVSEFTLMTAVWFVSAGVTFGLCARGFSFLTHFVSHIFRKIKYVPLRPALGGLAVAIGFWLVGSDRYAGLGVSVMESSMIEHVHPFDFLLKLLFTSLTLGSGFKGGEVTPLLFIGATLGNSLSYLIPLSFSELAALGFVGVFAGAANTPWTCAIMAMEIFGRGLGLPALVVCWFSFLVSGFPGIYHAQKPHR